MKNTDQVGIINPVDVVEVIRVQCIKTALVLRILIFYMLQLNLAARSTKLSRVLT